MDRAWLLSCLICVMAGQAVAAEIQLTSRAAGQLVALAQEKRARSNAETKLDTGLWYAVKRERGDLTPFSSLPELRTGLNIPRAPDSLARVTIQASMNGVVTATIESLGGRVLDVQPAHNSIVAEIPVAILTTVAGLSEVRSIRQAFPPVTNRINISAGVVSHDVTTVREFFALDGTGVKICAISDSFNNLGGAGFLIANGDLPGPGNPDGYLTPVDVVADLPGGGTDEGSAMLEIIFDMAPGSLLGFATAGQSKAQFASNIRALGSAGCNIIVDDIFFFSEAVFQDDVIAAAVDEVVEAGVLYFSAAGNGGNFNDGTSGAWEGDYVATPTVPPALQGFSVTTLDFGGGVNTNTITDDAPFAFTLHWSDPQGASGNDYDLVLLDATAENIVALGAITQNGNDDPYEIINSRNNDDTGLLLAVALDDGAERVVHLNTLRGELASNTGSQISGHTAARGAFAVGAVRAGTDRFSDTPPDGVETFSSDGPRRVFFAADGTPFTPGDLLSTGGELRSKPELAAANGVSTATAGFDPFFGTSAAAPHAAAIAALLLELDPTLDTATLMDDVLPDAAIDIEAAGRDHDSGWGVIDALAAAEAVAINVALAAPVPTGNNTQVSPPDTATGTTPVTLTFTATTESGVATLTLRESGPTLPPGFENCTGFPRFFDLASTAVFFGQVQVCVNISDAGCGNGSRVLHRFDGFQWIPLPGLEASGELCADADSLGSFALLTTLPVPVSLVPGANLFGPPRQPAGFAASCFELLTALGGEGAVSSISRIEAVQQFEMRCFFESGVPTGDDYQISAETGYIITMTDTTIVPVDARLTCPEIALVPGANLISVPAPEPDLDCYGLMNRFGPSVVRVVERLDPLSHQFQACAFTSTDELAGRDFPIETGVGYIVHAIQPSNPENLNDTGNAARCP